jgi:hypothetical protein
MNTMSEQPGQGKHTPSASMPALIFPATEAFCLGRGAFPAR